MSENVSDLENHNLKVTLYLQNLKCLIPSIVYVPTSGWSSAGQNTESNCDTVYININIRVFSLFSKMTWYRPVQLES